jgi:type VI secretion system protein ImpL
MKRTTKSIVIAGVVALIVVVGSALLPGALGVGGGRAWVLGAGLAVIGLAAIGLVLWYLLKRIAAQEGGGSASTGPDDIDVAVAAARDRLGASKVAGSGSLGNLPVIVVLGADGAAKTTVIMRSGLEPELLAGEIAQGDALVPTRAVNLWYAGGTVLVEAGGGIAADPPRWNRLVGHLHPQRLSAVFAGGEQAPRAALVCVSCEDLLTAGSSESVPAAARTLRARLGELSEQLGIRLPVYVLFTKADRIPYFAEYVHNFSREETQQVLGATLDVELEAPIGSYADRETARVTEAFTGIVRSLADKRLVVLSREHAAERRPAAYEFPRELRKIVPLATQFLVDLCKPSQLHSSPFLRGFYLTGVQAVVVTEAMPSAVAQPARAMASATIDATGVFARGASPAPAMSFAPPTARKVPRWLFLDRLFRDVILADRAVQDVTRGGTKVNVLRRAALATVTVAAAFLAIAFTISFAGNRALQRRTTEAAGAVTLIPASATDLPTADALLRLDSLRGRVALLREYERDGAPLHLRWGLHTGPTVLDAARREYFRNFDRLMFGATRQAMAGSLASLPDAPRASDEYGATYDLLKAYLITTSHPAHGTAEFLSPVLMRSWLGDRTIDGERMQLAQRQLDFYAGELPIENPFPAPPDSATVQRTRAFLAKFAGTERIYQFMLAEAGKANPAVRFDRAVPGSGAVLVNGYEVPGAFTKGGWTFVQNALSNVDRFFEGEAWVVGDQLAGQVDRAQVVRQLRAQYIADYQRHWRTFLRSASVARFGGLQDAGRKLTALSGNQSPLLALFSIVSRNTDVDSAAIAPVFQPVHQLNPPGITDKLIGEGNQAYINALVALASAVEQAANAPHGQSDAMMPAVTTSAATAKVATRQLAQSFRIDAEGHVETIVQSMLEAPIGYVESLTRTVGTSDLNARGRDFCAPFRRLMEKFPFSPSATVAATVPEIAAIFQPGSGSLHQFYDRSLQRALVREGNTFVQRPDSPVRPSPEFVAFLGRAMEVSDAFYRESATTPRMRFMLRPLITQNIEWVSVTIDGQTERFTSREPQARPFIWNGPTPASSASISVRAGRQEGSIASFQGPWSLFQLFHEVERLSSQGSVLLPEWPVRINGNQAMHDGNEVVLRAELHLGGVAPIMWERYFDRMTCVAEVTR